MMMKKTTIVTLSSALVLLAANAEDEDRREKLTEAEMAKALLEHQEGSEQVSIDQDIQSANTRELIMEQTDQKVIALLTQVEILMAKATDSLEDGDTGGDTIAMQTEIIEKIYEAAKQRSNSSPSPGGQPGMGAMLDMLGQMMGKQPGQTPGQNQEGESEQGGEGSTGDSDAANTDSEGPVDGQKNIERRVPKAAGSSGTSLPPEFQKALDGYNKKSPSE